MIKMSKKAIGAITGVSAALIAGTTVAVNLLMKNEKGAKTNNPLNRDKNYQYYSLINKISSNEKLNNLIGIQRTESSITYVIEEQRFIDNIRLIVQDALKEIPAFSEKYLNYVIDCHYKINTKSVLVDLVWYEPGAKNKFFDQFELLLQSS